MPVHVVPVLRPLLALPSRASPLTTLASSFNLHGVVALALGALGIGHCIFGGLVYGTPVLPCPGSGEGPVEAAGPGTPGSGAVPTGIIR